MSKPDHAEVRRLVSRIKRTAARYGANCRLDGVVKDPSNPTLAAFAALAAELDILASMIPTSPDAKTPMPGVIAYAAEAWRRGMLEYDEHARAKM